MTILVNFASICKQLTLAWKFGRGDDIDAFLIAFILPSFLVNVIGGSLNAAFIPTYIQVRQQEGVVSAQKLFSTVSASSLILLTLANLLTVTTAPFYLKLLGSNFSPEKLHLTFQLLCIVSPLIIFSGIITIWSAVLNSGERFALAAFTPAITPIVSIVFLIAFPFLGIYGLALSLPLGTVLEIIALGKALQKQGISFIPQLRYWGVHLNQVASQYIPMIAGAFLLSSTSLIDRAMAAMLEPGSVAALDYGNRLIALPLGLATTALSTAFVPYCSQMVAQGNWFGAIDTTKKYIFLSFALSIPLTILLVIFSVPLVELVFQRGAFTARDTRIVAQIQSCYALQIPFYISGIVLVRLISSLKSNHILMYGALISLVVNCLLNYIFAEVIGVKGIALSTSCVYVISFIYLLFYSVRTLKNYVAG
ncbi:polysaccharide biosynthesis C-terminal domain-containing protein [Oscillatoria sp. FACHB-1406]|nr:polysaccharide biosynthesis C-terminal domain-containing protein [Oscillatoria sp. FACHB-1406]